MLLDVEDYERLTDRAAFLEAIDEGARSARAGELHSNEEAMAILDTFGEADD